MKIFKDYIDDIFIYSIIAFIIGIIGLLRTIKNTPINEKEDFTYLFVIMIIVSGFIMIWKYLKREINT